MDGAVERRANSELGADPSAVSWRRSLRLLMAEGFLSEVFVSLTGGVFLTGVALELGAGAVTLSLLAAVPLLAQTTQLLGPWLERRLGSRHRFVIPAFAAGRLFWLVPTTLVFVGASGTLPLWLAIATVTAMASLVMLGANGWTAWMADVIPTPRRARWFGRRSWAVALSTLLVAPAAGFFIDTLAARGDARVAYGILGLVAALTGAAAGLTLLAFPRPAALAPSREGLLATARRLLAAPRYRRVIGLFSLWSVAIGLPAPFWTLYMLERLDMSFFLITLHTVVVLAVRLVTTGFWSRLIDRIGSHRVLIGCGLGIAGIPLLWLFASPTQYLPIWIEAVVAGFCWTGFNLAAFLQPIAVLEPSDRSRGLAFFNVCTGIALFTASVLGGLVLQSVGTDGRLGFAALFVASAVLRLLTSVWALRLTEPGLSVPGFIAGFLGHGMLRRPSVGRHWLSVGDERDTAQADAEGSAISSGVR